MKKKGLTYRFLYLSSFTICLASFLSEPKIIFERLVLDIKGLKYSSQINHYLQKYLIRVLYYYGILNLDVISTFVQLRGKLGRFDRSITKYIPDLPLIKPLKTRTISTNIYSNSVELKTTRGAVSFSFFIYYNINV